MALSVLLDVVEKHGDHTHSSVMMEVMLCQTRAGHPFAGNLEAGVKVHIIKL